MDWATHDHRPPRAAAPAAPTLVQTYWRVCGLTGKTITCGLYQTPAGHLEVRAGYSLDDLVRSQVVVDRSLGADVAAIWKAAALDKGFTDLDAPAN